MVPLGAVFLEIYFDAEVKTIIGGYMREAFEILRAVKSAVISTVDEGTPQSRIIDIMDFDEGGIYFISLASKPFYRQLMTTKKVAITAMDENYVQVRIVGEVKVVEQEKVMDIFEKNPAMGGLFPDEENKFTPFYVHMGKGEVFDLSGRERKLKRQRFAFGGETVNQAGCIITESCIECGICKKECPFDAIEEGSPYKIESSYCDECGICYNICPVNAIDLPKGL